MPASYGIEIGSEAVRAVQLQRKGTQWQVAGAVEVSRYNDAGEERLLGQSLAEVVTTLPPKGRVVVGDTHHSLMVRFFASMPLPPDRLRRLQRLEMQQHVDQSGDMAMDARVLPLAGDELISCCVLAPPEQVQTTLAMTRAAGIKRPLVTPSSLAMGALVPLPDDDEEEVSEGATDTVDQLLLDIGASGTRVVLVRDGHMIGARHLGIGGQDFTKALMTAESCSWAKAERMKKQWSQRHAPAPEPAPAESANELRSDDDDELRLDDDDELRLDDDDDLLRLSDDDDTDDELLVITGATPPASFKEEPEDHLDLDDDPAGPAESGSRSYDDDFVDDVLGSPDPEEVRPRAEVEPPPRVETGVFAQPGQETLVMGQEELGEVFQPLAERLCTQIASSLEYLRKQLHQKKLDIQVIEVTGGAARLHGLQHYLQQRFDLPVSSVDLWGRFDDDGHADQRYDGALALAWAPHAGDRPFDLRPESVQAKDVWYRELLWPRIAAGLVLAAAVVLVVADHFRSESMAAKIEAYQENQQRYDSLSREFHQAQEQRRHLYNDLRGIASRIFAARDLLNSIRVLKLKAPNELWITVLRTEGLSGEAGNAGGDTAIERGQLYLRGEVKPLSGQRIAKKYDYMQDWKQEVQNWEPMPGQNLFAGGRIIEVRSRAEEEGEGAFAAGEFEFEVRFQFTPTDLTEVVTGEHADLIVGEEDEAEVEP